MSAITEVANAIIVQEGSITSVGHTSSTVDTSAMPIRCYAYLPGDTATVVGSTGAGATAGVQIDIDIDVVGMAAGEYIYECIADYGETNPVTLIPNTSLADLPDTYLGYDGPKLTALIILPTNL